MKLNLISKRDYKLYSKELEHLMLIDPSPGSDEAKRLKLLSLAVEEYEKHHFPFDPPSPVDAIKFRMEEMGLTQADVAKYFGGKNRVSEILAMKRSLTLPMIKSLNKNLGIPLEVLLADIKVIKKSKTA